MRVAARLGANPVRRGTDKRSFARLAGLRKEGYLVAFEADGSPGALQFAMGALAPGGVCTAASFNFQKHVKFRVWEMMMKSTRFETGFARPSVDLPRILDLVRTGKFDPGAVTTHLADWEDAPTALLHPSAKVVVTRDRLSIPRTD
ncbi:MAG: hypothetical protein ACFB00_11540 [Parvularculaceae bacterium]